MVALLYFYFRILPSNIVNHDVFLLIGEFPVASFCKSRALIPRKYMAEQSIRVSNWSEIFKSLWSHSSFFDLEQSNLSASDKFRTVIPFSATFVLEMNAQVLDKVATKGSSRGKKNLKNLHFWGYFSKAKTVECVQNNLNVSDKFGTFLPCSASYFLEVSAVV